ncbi:MAG: DUF3795 domain-containing protein [Tissierellia bacterium]|nr:DUF3795 domain-containing protein [Tissierellia bacterium]
MNYDRKYPIYSLCGLNCGLCPNYHSTGSFICPGCGGKDFYSVHPKCSIITCAITKDIEFCHECNEFPCSKYAHLDNEIVYDSFISYQNVKNDIVKVRHIGIEAYCDEQNDKIKILEYLLNNYNAGRQKSFFCVAVNLLELSDIKSTLEKIESLINDDMDIKTKSQIAVNEFKFVANQRNIDIKLIKNKPKERH